MELWVNKYRPQTTDDYLGNTTLINQIDHFLEKGNIPHLLFFGPAGTGKTSLAKLIVKGLECEYLYINASDERGIDTIRDKIVPFASSIGFGDTKVVILDESDYLTPQAQATLRNTMETFSVNTRFILTCNYLERIISPLQSRCQSFEIIPPDKMEVREYCGDILDHQQIEYSQEDLQTVTTQFYPDIRKIINTLQGSVVSNKLIIDDGSIKNSEIGPKVLEGLKNRSSIANLRQIIASSGAKEFDSLFRYLYDNVNIFAESEGEAILAIAKYQYEYTFVIDKEICIAAMLNKLLKLC